MGLAFRRLVDADLPMLHRWLNEPGIVRWWEGDDVSWDAVVKDYGSGSEDSTEHWIATCDDRDVGWIQCWPTADEPEEAAPWFELGIARTAAGIDYLIGDPADRGRGIGSALIRAFVADVVFGRHPEWTQACAAPVVANVASWRALGKAGFRFVAVVDDDKNGPCRLMAIDRATPPPCPDTVPVPTWRMARFKKGDKVIITHGDFDGRWGVIVDKDIIGDELTVALGEDGREIRTHEAHVNKVEDD